MLQNAFIISGSVGIQDENRTKWVSNTDDGPEYEWWVCNVCRWMYNVLAGVYSPKSAVSQRDGDGVKVVRGWSSLVPHMPRHTETMLVACKVCNSHSLGCTLHE